MIADPECLGICIFLIFHDCLLCFSYLTVCFKEVAVFKDGIRLLICFFILTSYRFIEALPLEGYNFQIVEDTSSYRKNHTKIAKILLPNGLEVLLISDPYASESAGGICVEAGSWDDPEEFSGMAHFVEHLLFLGTEAYPGEQEFMQYIQERGGGCNASTARDRTSYGFFIQTENFSEGLDRFAHLFIDPLFNQNAIEREKNAVHHEFEDSIENDFFRMWRIFKETGNPAHPNRKFSCGNLRSLHSIQAADVKHWFINHYQPSRMHLVLSSSLPVEQLMKLASNFFGTIPERKNIAAMQRVFDSMSSEDQKGSFFYIAPTFNNKILSLMWEVPRRYMQTENVKSLSLLERAINRSHPSSIHKILEDEGLAMHVKAEFWKVEKEHGIFRINVNLTQEGLKRYETVVSKCFQAINSFKQCRIPDQFLAGFKVSRFASAASKDFRGVMEIAAELVDEPLSGYPKEAESTSTHLIEKAQEFLEELSPKNCVYFLISRFEEGDTLPTNLEKWMGAEYFKRNIPADKIRSWEAELPHPQISLVPGAESDREDLFLEESLFEDNFLDLEEPAFIVNTTSTRIRLVEPSLKSDRLETFFFIDTPSIGGSVKNWAASEIFTRAMNGRLQEFFSNGEDVNYEFEIDGRKLCIFLSLPKKHATEYLTQAFVLLRNPGISPGQFEKAKKCFLEQYAGDPDPMEHAQKILESLITGFQSTEMELYHNVAGFTYEEYGKWEKTIFDLACIEGAFLGNLRFAEAEEIWQRVRSVFPYTPYRSYDLIPKTCVYLEEKKAHCLFQKTHRQGNALLLMIASKGEYVKNGAAKQVIAALLQSEFFCELRTRQQTVYKLHNWTRIVNNAICYGFSLQSSTHHPLDLVKRVDAFLDDFSKNARDKCSIDRFEVLRETLMNSWKKHRRKASKQEERVFADRNLDMLQKLSYEKLLKTIEETFSLKNRKRIAVLIEGRDFSYSEKEDFSSIHYELIGECI